MDTERSVAIIVNEKYKGWVSGFENRGYSVFSVQQSGETIEKLVERVCELKPEVRVAIVDTRITNTTDGRDWNSVRIADALKQKGIVVMATGQTSLQDQYKKSGIVVFDGTLFAFDEIKQEVDRIMNS